MTVTLNLKPELEEGLFAQAQAASLSVEAYLEKVVEERLGVPKRRLSVDEWTRQFEEWANSFPEAPQIPDEALSRENLYPDRW